MSDSSRDCARLVFLARSSLQVLLATALAADARQRHGQASWLLFVPDVIDPGMFSQALDRADELPFERIALIDPRRPGTAGRPQRSDRTVRAELLALLREAQPQAVAVFNDRQAIGQGLLIDAAREFPQAQRLCVEDGSQAYTRYTYARNSAWTRWRQRLRLGAGWHAVTVLGTHPLVQRFVAMHPQRLRPELRGRAVQPFPVVQLHGASVQGLARALCAAAGQEPQALGDEATLFVISHSDYAERNPQYGVLLAQCLAASPQPVLFKYHPRERQADYMGLAARGARELPRGVPVEGLFLLSRLGALRVVAGMSTALLTARLLMPRSRIAALTHATEQGDAWDDALMSDLALHAVRDLAGYERFLQQDAPADQPPK